MSMLKKNGFTLIEVMIVVVVICIFSTIIIGGIKGCSTGGTGPTSFVENAKVIKTYVDTSKTKKTSESHYMVSTDKGVFEVGNGMMLGVYNADEIFGKLQEGKTYTFKTKGKKVVNMFMQEYPYIVSFNEINTNNTVTILEK